MVGFCSSMYGLLFDVGGIFGCGCMVFFSFMYGYFLWLEVMVDFCRFFL